MAPLLLPIDVMEQPMLGRMAATAERATIALDNPYRAPVTSSVVTRPETRLADQALASRSSRLAALLIDYLIVVAAALPVLAMELWVNRVEAESLLTPLTAVFLLELVAIGIAQCVLIVRHGQSLGKRWMRIRIVDHATGERPSWVRLLLVRVLGNLVLRQIPFYYPLDGLFILGADRRCLHDVIAGTKVVES